jgi:hypothetical protein
VVSLAGSDSFSDKARAATSRCSSAVAGKLSLQHLNLYSQRSSSAFCTFLRAECSSRAVAIRQGAHRDIAAFFRRVSLAGLGKLSLQRLNLYPQRHDLGFLHILLH